MVSSIHLLNKKFITNDIEENTIYRYLPIKLNPKYSGQNPHCEPDDPTECLALQS